MRLKMWGAPPMLERLVISAAVMLCFVCVAAFGDDFLHARVSFDAGTSMVKGHDDADWSYATINTIVLPNDTLWVDKEGTMELEMSGGSFLRMADGSKADIEALPPSARIRGWSGSFYVQRIGRSTGSVELDTPICVVDFDPKSQVRVDIAAEGGTTVSVRWGHATVRCEAGGETSLNAGQRSYVDPGYLPSEPAAFDANTEDDFDSWNRDRAHLLAEGEQHVPPAVHMAQAPIGVADLSPYGEWVELDSAYYWRPTVVADYVPYRNGHWSYVGGAGYCWVGGYPFSYVTTHYGRWRYTEHYGWMWTYRDTWGPAWVESVHYGPNFVWTPLDPFDRPCVAIGDTFAVGSASFGYYGSSYCLADDLYMGRCRVMPMTAVVVTGVPVAQITVWDIHVGSHRSYHHDFARECHLEVRDYPPTRVIRGYDSFGSRESAHVRVTSLETSYGRHEFATHHGEPPRQRAAFDRHDRHDGHGAQVRNVRVAPDIRESAGDPHRSAAIMHSPMTPEGRGKPGRGERSGGPSGHEGARTMTVPTRESGKNPAHGERSGAASSTEGSRTMTVPTRESGRKPARGERSGGASTSEGTRTMTAPTRESGRNPVRGERSGGASTSEGTRTMTAPTRESGRNPSRGERSGAASTSEGTRTMTAPTRESGRNPSRGERSGAASSSEGTRTMTVPERSRSTETGRAPARGGASSNPSAERSTTRSRETGPAPVPMRGAESAPSRTSPQRSETLRAVPTESVVPRSEGTRTRGVETVGRQPTRDVQIQRLAPPERSVAEPRQERDRSPQASPAPRVEQPTQAAPQLRQVPTRQQAPAGRGSRSGDDDSHERKRR